MIPLHSSWFQWGHSEVMHIPFFPRKKHHSTTATLHNASIAEDQQLQLCIKGWHTGDLRQDLESDKCWSYEAYEETLAKLRSTPHPTSSSMIFFYFLPTQLT